MAHRSVWQGIRRWLRSGDRRRTEEIPAGTATAQAGASGSTGSAPPAGASGSTGSAPTEWPSNVLPFVRPERPERPGSEARPEGIAVVEHLSDASAWSVGADGAAAMDDAADDAELLEFLAADLDPVPADPVFRERLREQLWEMVVTDARLRVDRDDARSPRLPPLARPSLTRRPDPV